MSTKEGTAELKGGRVRREGRRKGGREKGGLSLGFRVENFKRACNRSGLHLVMGLNAPVMLPGLTKNFPSECHASNWYSVQGKVNEKEKKKRETNMR